MLDLLALQEALRAAPRRYRMPPLPPLEAAAAAGPDAALACAIESLRVALADGRAPPPAARGVFTDALAQAIEAALQEHAGDPAFRALLLRRSDPQVAAYAQLAATHVADRRRVRGAVDAHAHPGKWRAQAHANAHAMAALHELARQERWAELARALEQPAHAHVRSGVPAQPLQRLVRRAELDAAASVQEWLRLCRLCGPARGSAAASASGRDGARTGVQAERDALRALGEIAARLERVGEAARSGPTARSTWRAVRSLRTPAGFPGATAKAKDEWDVALVRHAGTGGEHATHDAWDIALLVEVKAAPAAAASDYPRLLRGLERLAGADSGLHYTFPCAGGPLQVAGASLQALAPRGRELPPHVIYACTAAAESRPLPLAAAAKAVLLAEPAALAHARALQAGQAPRKELLGAIWDELPVQPRLRGVLHQYATARAARDAMLHPDDLVAALDDRLAADVHAPGAPPRLPSR